MAKHDFEKAIAELKPGSTAAKVRALMPSIERQLASGVRRKDVVEALNKAGLNLAETNFNSIVARYRKKHGTSTSSTTPPPVRREASTPPAPNLGESEAQQPARSDASDNVEDPDGFERSLNLTARDQFADEFMGQHRPFGAKKRSTKK